MKTVAIIGPGAMGCLFATYLSQGGLQVSLVDHLAERAELLGRTGLRVSGVRGEHQAQVPVFLDARKLGPVDLVMVCVKAYSTEKAMAQHLALVGPDTVVWTVQNGLGNTEAIARVVPPAQVMGGSTTLGANLLDEGQVHHAGDGDTFLGELSGGDSDRAQAMAQTLAGAGLKVQVSDDIQKLIWTKLLVNVGINALTAMLRVRNGVLAELQPTLHLMHDAVAEGLEVARSQGIELDGEWIQDRVVKVAQLTAQNRSSMLADILAAQRTEIDFINGAICRLGRAPVNQTLTRLIHSLEATATQREKSA